MLRTMDSLSRPTREYLSICIGLGAIAGLIAGYSNSIYGGLISPIHDTNKDLYIIILVSVVAPIGEESIKPLGLYLLKSEERISLNLQGWVILGAFAGMGFGLIENGFYALSVMSYGGSAIVTLMALRFLLSLPIHMLNTSIAAFGFGLWDVSGEGRHFFKFLILAVLIHGFYNYAMVTVG